MLRGLTLQRGTFRAALHAGPGQAMPEVELVVDGEVVGRAAVAADAAGNLALSADVPVEALEDGVRTVVFRVRGTGQFLARHVLRAGAALDGDVVAALDALEAELAALKRAFMADAADRKLRSAERPLIVEEAVTAVLREIADDGASLPRRRTDD